MRDPRTQPAFGDDVDVALQQILKIHQETPEVEQAAIGFEIDKEVHVARLGRFASRDRPEHTTPRRTPGASDLDDLAAPCAQLGQRRCGHEHRIRPPDHPVRVVIRDVTPARSH